MILNRIKYTLLRMLLGDIYTRAGNGDSRFIFPFQRGILDVEENVLYYARKVWGLEG